MILQHSAVLVWNRSVHASAAARSRATTSDSPMMTLHLWSVKNCARAAADVGVKILACVQKFRKDTGEVRAFGVACLGGGTSLIAADFGADFSAGTASGVLAFSALHDRCQADLE